MKILAVAARLAVPTDDEGHMFIGPPVNLPYDLPLPLYAAGLKFEDPPVHIGTVTDVHNIGGLLVIYGEITEDDLSKAICDAIYRADAWMSLDTMRRRLSDTQWTLRGATIGSDPAWANLPPVIIVDA